jgi:hypothetical protein
VKSLANSSSLRAIIPYFALIGNNQELTGARTQARSLRLHSGAQVLVIGLQVDGSCGKPI